MYILAAVEITNEKVIKPTEKMLNCWKIVSWIFFIKVVVVNGGNAFDKTCGQHLKNPGTTSGGIRASVAPWTVSLGIHHVNIRRRKTKP